MTRVVAKLKKIKDDFGLELGSARGGSNLYKITALRRTLYSFVKTLCPHGYSLQQMAGMRSYFSPTPNKAGYAGPCKVLFG